MANNNIIAPDITIQTNDFLKKCNDKDVLSINSEQWIGIQKLKDDVENAFKFSKGITSITDRIYSYSGLNHSKLWFEEGEECEILRAGSSGWQKGKIKINVTLEFIPDEPENEESPLDDIRQAEINNM